MARNLLPKDEATGAPRELPYYDEATGLYRYTVDCGTSSIADFGRLLAACRFDGYVNAEFTFENFPLATQGRFEITAQLLHLNEVVHTRKVLALHTEANLLRPNPEHLLGFATAFPDVQQQFIVVGLINCPWQDCYGRARVPCLWSTGRTRKLHLDNFDKDWDEDYCFLGLPPLVRRLSA